MLRAKHINLSRISGFPAYTGFGWMLCPYDPVVASLHLRKKRDYRQYLAICDLPLFEINAKLRIIV